MEEFKIRCSAIGKIMTNARSRTGVLSKTAKTYCKQWLKEQVFNRKIEFSSKYTDKGNMVEDESISFLSNVLGFYVLKNYKHFSNDFCTGTPDIMLKDFVIDVKNSWDVSTFPYYEKELPNKEYWWQGQGYMWLTNKKKYKVIYILSDTPPELIEREIKSYQYKNGIAEVSEEIVAEFYRQNTYSDLPNDLRYKVFEFERDEEAIKQIKEKVLLCRKYIKEL